MKKQYHILILLVLFAVNCHAQYVVKSVNILNPDVNIEYVRNNAEFWINHAYEPTYGGFYSNINRVGNVINSTNVHTNAVYQQKSLVAQTRQGYGFTRAFMLTGDEKYLTYAKSALDFLIAHGWDTTNDGWYCFANKDGSLDHGQWWDPNTGKWGFQQQYALVGIVANYEATHDATIKSWMDKGINSIYTHLWDVRPGYEGYYEQANLDWTGLSGKGFTSTVDAITTNAELSYLVTQDPAKKARLAQLANIIVTKFIPQMDDSRVKVLYPETYTNDWVVSDYTADASIGHFIKTSWVLGRAYLCDTTKKELKDAASKILDKAWTYTNNDVTVWDHLNGGPFNNLKVSTGGWGASGDNKDYWTLEQGFTGPMINYYITKNPIYLQMADEAISFYMNHFIDATYGETYMELDPLGTTFRNSDKGDMFKANYHSSEFGYYAYLYSNLYYLHQPASLYYKFAASTSAQTIKLTPIPMEDGLLRIKSVTLDGLNFANFDPISRTLNIAANQGGKFKVTYESLLAPTAVRTIENNQIIVSPNPTTGIFNVEGMENICDISIVDVSGKILLERNIQGLTTLNLNIQEFKTGIYFVVLKQNTGQKLLKKIIKL